jgi:hypothetical protein
VLPPTQIAEFAELAVTVGNGLTVTPTVAVFTQPLAFVPVTVYVVLVVGDTVTDEPDKLPGVQTYVLAPPPVNAVEPPIQIALFAEAAVTVGNGLMVNKNVVGELVPQVLPAVTVTLPDVEPAVTLMLVVPWPELITVPAGTVHV